MKSNFDSFYFDFTELIIRVFFLILFINNFESITEHVSSIKEKLIQDDVLVFFQDSVFTFNKSRKQPYILCCQLWTILILGFFIKSVDQVLNLSLINSCLNGFRIVLKNSNQARLNVLSIDIFQMFKEKINPSS